MTSEVPARALVTRLCALDLARRSVRPCVLTALALACSAAYSQRWQSDLTLTTELESTTNSQLGVRCAAAVAFNRIARAGQPYGASGGGGRSPSVRRNTRWPARWRPSSSCPVVLPLLNKTSRPEVGNYYGYYGPEEKPS